ncbi:phage distal tail protein [Streptomyces sp. NPDC098789]|uniref:phage distal tail protein n=1 Tax=Streptomyces sp. NPDC098789 TaxID=3366098 RepID=UPI0037FADC83
MAGSRVVAPGHVQFGDDLLLGPHTAYGWRTLTGWEDSPGLDSGTVARSGAHGAYLGRLLAQPRTITLDNIVIRTEPRRMGAAVRALRAATALRDDEEALVMQLDDEPPLLAFARCIRRSIPVTAGGYALGIVTGAALQFEASDPRRYSLIEQQATTVIGGSLRAVNDGDAPAHPVITIRGPLSLPSLTDTLTKQVLEYDVDLGPADTLLIDTAASTATVNGESCLGTATARSTLEELYALPPGASTLSLRAAPGSVDPRAQLAIRWRSAYW